MPPLGKYAQVARLHREGIDRGFLSTLGDGFLALLYQAIDESRDSALVLAEQDGRVVGFAAGTLGLGGVYRSLLKRPLRLASALLPSLASPRRILRIAEVVLHKGEGASTEAYPRAELLSIAVDRAYRGQGHADRLYTGLTDFFRSKKARRFKIIAGAPLVPAHRFYARMGARPAGTIEIHRGEKSVVFIQEVSECPQPS